MAKSASLLLRIINKIGISIKISTPIVDGLTYFYNISPTCQVARLTAIYECYFGRRIDDYFQLRGECSNIAQYFYENSYKVIYKYFFNTINVPKEFNPKM